MQGNTRILRSVALLAFFMLCCVAVARAELADAEAIRAYLEGLDAGAEPVVSGRRLERPEALSQFYRSRDHAPVWLPGAPLEKAVPGLLAAIDESVSHGFVPARYHRADIEQLWAAQPTDLPRRLALELLLTDAFLTQALHRSRGVVAPPDLDENWRLPPTELDAAALLQVAAREGHSVHPVLQSLWPTSADYALLLKRRAEILSMEAAESVSVSPGPLLRPGDSGERVLQLKRRLLGPGDYTLEYDAGLRREVIAFQLAAGLDADGVVGANTLEVLNASRVSWIDRIDANLERWRWLPREMPETYLRVNIAAYTLRAFEQGEPTLSMNVIVGKPYRRTPVFAETLKYMVLNPYWNVPFSIATRDKLPLLQADAVAEAEKGFEVRPPARDVFVPVDAIDWTPVTRRSFNYLLRQKPGPENALGNIKFMMPNPYAVYLHDTPSRELFARQERSFSSGCIRLEQPLELARWLLSREAHPQAERIEALMSARETLTINLKRPVPTYLVYLTAFATDTGEIAFRRDIYNRDAVLVEALRASAAKSAEATALDNNGTVSAS
jgi:murein L,D-transpeptidase YcbB/YkuD